MSYEAWSAVVDAEQGEDGLFVPLLMLFSPEAEEPLRVPLHGVYWTALEAIQAGRQAVAAMAER